MRRFIVWLVAVLLMTAAPAFAAGTFCDGFRDGWTAAFRSKGRAPLAVPGCPASSSPLTYENGFAAGMEAALRRL